MVRNHLYHREARRCKGEGCPAVREAAESREWDWFRACAWRWARRRTAIFEAILAELVVYGAFMLVVEDLKGL